MDVKIRKATPEDAPQIAEVHIRSWRQAYKGIIHQSYLDNGLDVTKRTRAWQENLSESRKATFLAFNGASLAGFVSVGKSRDGRYSDHAELYAIYLDPDYFGKGVGKALFSSALQHAAKKEGFRKMFAVVLTENLAGRDFYERMGAIPIEGSEEELTVDGHPYMEMKYSWEDLSP